MNKSFPGEKKAGKPAGGGTYNIPWRAIWTILFVFMAVEAIFVGALVSSHKKVNVTSPVLEVENSRSAKPISSDDVAALLTGVWEGTGVKLHFAPGGRVAASPEAYFKALSADVSQLKETLKLADLALPRDVFIFGDEIAEALAALGMEHGWADGDRLFVSANGSPARPLLGKIASGLGKDIPGMKAALADFLSGFLDFYNSHPYEDYYQANSPQWQVDTDMAALSASAVLDDQRLAASFISLPERGSEFFSESDPASVILERGFLRYLLDAFGWDGFAKMLKGAESSKDPFEAGFGKKLPDLLKDYQAKLDATAGNAAPDALPTFNIVRANLSALSAGALVNTPAAQVRTEALTVLRQEVKRFKLATGDLAPRYNELGNLLADIYLLFPDPLDESAKKYGDEAVQVLMSGAANQSELYYTKNYWTVGTIKEAAGDFEEADKQFSAVLSRKEVRSYYLPKYAAILVARRNFQRAADCLSEHLARNPDDLWARYELMGCLAKLGEGAACAAEAEKVAAHPLIARGYHADWKTVAESLKARYAEGAEPTKTEFHSIPKPQPDAPDKDKNKPRKPRKQPAQNANQ